MKKLVTLLFVAGLFMSAGAWAQDYEKGVDAYLDGDYATAEREFRPLAEEGHAWAQFALGTMYLNGEGVIQNYREAVKWLTLSAENGNIGAQNNLGVMYEKGQGVSQDHKKAAKWYKLSAEQGDSWAQAKLGAFYLLGFGVPQDNIRAHMWINLAASNGHEKSAEFRDSIAEKMTPAQIEKAQELAHECLAKDYKGC